MTFAAPHALWALFAVPAVVVLHLYRRRLRERRVAALFLFAGDRLVTSAGRTRSRLLRTASLWLECALAALLALWLAGPSFGGAVARHVVFVLDDSASMQAGAAARAAAAVARRIGELASHDRVTLLRTGPRPDVLVGPDALPDEARGALVQWRPARPRHDPTPALDLARELAHGTGEVVFATDERPALPVAGATVLGFGQPQANAALLSVQRFRRADGRHEVRVRVGGYAGASTTELRVRAGEHELLHRTLDLAHGPADVALEVPADTGDLELALSADALAIDDVAWLLPEPVRTVNVCDRLPLAVRGPLGLDRVFAAVDDIAVETDPLAAQLLLDVAPGTPLAGQTEVVVDAGPGERDGFRGPFVVDRGNAWLAGIRLDGVVWLAGRRDLPGLLLVAVGNRGLVSEEFTDAGRRLWLNLDPSAGNVVRSPDWPLLFANLVEQCRDEVPGVVDPHLVLGDEARYRRSMRANGPDARLELVLPDGTHLPGRGDRTVGWIVDRPGVHRVLGADGRELGRCAVRFHDPWESDLGRAWTGEVAPPPIAAADGGAVRDTAIERRVLVLVLLLVALADWWLLAGRTR